MMQDVDTVLVSQRSNLALISLLFPGIYIVFTFWAIATMYLSTGASFFFLDALYLQSLSFCVKLWSFIVEAG